MLHTSSETVWMSDQRGWRFGVNGLFHVPSFQTSLSCVCRSLQARNLGTNVRNLINCNQLRVRRSSYRFMVVRFSSHRVRRLKTVPVTTPWVSLCDSDVTGSDKVVSRRLAQNTRPPINHFRITISLGRARQRQRMCDVILSRDVTHRGGGSLNELSK